MSKKRCFIITPISSDKSNIRVKIDGLIDEIISPLLEEKGYEIYVAHRMYNIGSINKEIIKSLYTADLVIANLTTLNPNVMYELAVSHCLRKPTITLMENSDERIPFDIIDQRTIFYDDSISGSRALKENLLKVLDNIINNIEITNPIYDVIDVYNIKNIINEKITLTTENEQLLLNKLLNKLFDLDVEPGYIPDDEEYNSLNKE